MKISLISWIVSTETDPREEGHPLLELFPGSTPADKAPFEPLKEASLKHLTIKTVFLLALGSGKRRVRSMLGCITTSDTRLVHGCLSTPQPAFLPRISWPKRVQTVWPPWLMQPWSPLWISHRSLCPVRALCYHLGRTSDLRHNKELVFVSFQERFRQGHLSCHHLPMDQATVILCYELSDQQALALHQVKAHDVRAFAASKAFQSGVSLEQSSQPSTVSHISPSHSSEGCG